MKKKNKSVTLSDIAEKLGVSVVSVSNALNGKKGIGEELSMQIRKVAEEMGYKRRTSISNVKSTHNIGVIIAQRYVELEPSFYMDIYRKLVIKAALIGCFITLEVLVREKEEKLVLPEMIENSTIEGIIVLGEVTKAYTDYLSSTCKEPCVFLDYYEDIKDTDFIVTNGYRGMYRMTMLLIKAGHREIAFVGTPLAISSITDRYLGYCKALFEHDIELDEDWVIPDRKVTTTDIKIELPTNMPTAFVCSSDITAGVLIPMLQEKGYRVPEDISVVGYDHYLMPPIPGIELTTYEVDMDAMAQIGLNTVLERMRAGNSARGLRVVEGHIINGTSIKQIED